MTKKSNILEFINKSNIKHNYKFDYSKSIYLTAKDKIEIICLEHGSFWQTPSNHLSGSSCYTCKKFKSNLKFIQESNDVHNFKYLYCNTKYTNSKNKNKVEVKCRVHGVFKIRPDCHLSGQGCRECSNISKSDTLAFFIEKSNKVHKNKFRYDNFIYINYDNKSYITCSSHGDFIQSPKSHYAGHGCPKCKIISSSKVEKEWLDFLNIDNKYRQFSFKINNKSINVDGYDPNTNTIYEFYGDFWHGNPNVFPINGINSKNGKSYNYLFNKTMSRKNSIECAGYKVIYIWENDWFKFKKLCNNFPLYL